MTTYEYGLSIVSENEQYAVYRNGKPCVTGLLKPVTFKTFKAAENYIAKQVKISAADEALGEDGRKTLREEREAVERAEKAERDAAFDERLRRERTQKEARQNRYALNSFLRGRGYTWSDLGFRDEEDADFTDFTSVSYGSDWQLFSPDNRAVTLREAMQELAFQDIRFAKEWLAARNIPAIEKKHQEETAVRESKETEQQEYKQRIKDALLSNGLTEAQAEQEAERLSHTHSAADDTVDLASEQLSEDEDVTITIDSDLFYRVEISGTAYTIDEILALHNFLATHHEQLVQYAQQNRER